MPFPWKKVKGARISQWVSDHLHKSQKRRDGSSLVVETGFPTSLVDLFIKNHEKLKKPPKTKQRHNPSNLPIGNVNDPAISGIPFSSPRHPAIVGPLTPTYSPLHNLSALPLSCSSENEISVMGSSGGGTVVDTDEEGCDRVRGRYVNKIFLGVIKTLAVVLALGTKRLAVGIAISAILLLFLDYVGKHVSQVLRSIVQRVSRLLRFNKIMLDAKNNVALMPDMNPDKESHGSRDEDFQVVEPKSYSADEIQPMVDEIMNESSLGKLLAIQETESMEEEMMEKEESFCYLAESKRKSRRAKIKSKMKKLVPKKFKSSRKEQGPQRAEESVDNDTVFLPEEQLDQCVENHGEFENGSTSSSPSGGRYGEEYVTSETCPWGRLSDACEEANTKRSLGQTLC